MYRSFRVHKREFNGLLNFNVPKFSPKLYDSKKNNYELAY